MKFLKQIATKVLILVFFINTNLWSKAAPESFADLAEELMPSVVNISTTQTVKTQANPFPFQFPPGSPFGEMFKEFDRPTERKATSLGSGFVIKKNGTVITNNHVIANAEDIIVRINNKEYKAKVIGADPYSDLAVLKIDTKESFKIVEFGNSDKARVGDWVMAIGNPFGLGGTVTSGIISARNRDINLTRYDDFIQTDAVINPGNSGGPMVNLQGQVVGINSAIASTTGVYQGYGFAIPINLARRIMEDLVEYGYVKRPRIGVQIQDVAAEDAEAYGLPSVSGVLVQSVDETGPSAGALEAEDVIRALDGQPIGYVSELQAEIAERRPGDQVKLTIFREGREASIDIRLGEAPLNNFASATNESPILAEERLGIQVELLDPKLAREAGFEEINGVLLTEVTRGSAAERRNVGAFVGQQLFQVNDTGIGAPQDLRDALDGVEAGDIVSLHFRDRTGVERVVNVRMP